MFRMRSTLLPMIGLLLVGCAQQNEYKPAPPPNVNVAKPIIKTVTNFLEETGTAEAAQRVEIRARVQGFLDQIDFEDGDDVEAGQQLYGIQDSEYQAAVAKEQANIEAANVEAERAKIELDRQERLFKDNATPETSVVQARSEYRNALAQQKVAEAALTRAQLDLDYCQVTTPIAGRVERTLVKLGNLVGSGGEATKLTTVVSYDPIHVYFNISERALLQASQRENSEESKPDIKQVKAYVKRALDEGFPFEGHLDYADLGVDSSTGTFTIRAVFDNPYLKILPGLFVRVRIPLDRTENAVLLPEYAIGNDQVGRYVMIVGDGNVAERRNVKVGAKYGEMVVITTGLSGTETVVIDGLQRARPGSEVTPKEITLEAPSGDLESVESETPPATNPETETEPPSDSDAAPESASNEQAVD